MSPMATKSYFSTRECELFASARVGKVLSVGGWGVLCPLTIFGVLLGDKLGSIGLVTKSCRNLAIPWVVNCQAPLSVGFSRQDYWSGLPFLSPEDLLNLGIEPGSLALQADSLGNEKPTPVLLPGKFHGWKSLVGYSPWDGKESDTTERLHWFTSTIYH